MKKNFITLTIILSALFTACVSDDDNNGFQPEPPPVAEEGSVVINEVGYLGDQVELFNNGTVDVELDGYFLCLGPGTYRQIGNLVTGSTNLAPGEFLVVTYDQLNAPAGQIDGASGTGGLGLYIDNTGFADPSTLVDFVQWGAAGSIRETTAVQAGQWIAGQFVEVIGSADNSIIFDGEGDGATDFAETTTPSFGSENGAPVTPVAEVVSIILNEVEFLGDQVELFNNGNVAVDVSDYFLCLAPTTYRRVGDLPSQGNTTIEPGEFLVLTYDQINNGAGRINDTDGTGGLGLYIDNSDFASADNILDFVQWGSAGAFREQLAVDAGIWTLGDFVEVGSNAGTSIIFDGEGDAASDWAETIETSFGAENGDPIAPNASVVLNEVEFLGDQVELFNNGNVAVDVSDYFLCLGPASYLQIGQLTIVNGTTTIEPGEFLTIQYTALNIDFGNNSGIINGEVGTGGLALYNEGAADTGFGDVNNLIDFVQWGNNGSFREQLAVDAGIWALGEFVEVIGDEGGTSIIFDGEGDSAADWAETIETSFGVENGTPVAPNASVVLNEVQFVGDQVELFNNGNIAVDVSDYFLTLDGNVTNRQIRAQQFEGNITIQPGEFLVIVYDLLNSEFGGQINGENATGGLGLYSDNVGNTGFSDPDSIVDFVQWGATGSNLEEVAVDAGLWTLGEFVEVVDNENFSIVFDGAGISAADWALTTTPTFGDTNVVTAAQASVVINEVEFRGDQVELFNNGDLPVDVSGYFLCLAPTTYRQIGGLTITNGGNLVLQPGEFLVVTYDQLNVGAGLVQGQEGTGGLGLYVDSQFGNANSIVDFVQWGSDGAFREGLAGTANIWTVGDVVPVTGSATNTLSFDGAGNASTDWTEGTSTLGAPNN